MLAYGKRREASRTLAKLDGLEPISQFDSQRLSG